MNLKVENIQNNKEFIPLVADWIYNEFIIGHIPNCSLDDISDSIKSRKINEIPMTLICLSGNKCVGTISIFKNDLSKLPDLSPWLAALYVDKKYRNRGIAQLLISEVDTIIKKLGYKKLYLRTETANTYYQKLGWKHIIEITDENGIFTTVFEKHL